MQGVAEGGVEGGAVCVGEAGVGREAPCAIRVYRQCAVLRIQRACCAAAGLDRLGHACVIHILDLMHQRAVRALGVIGQQVHPAIGRADRRRALNHRDRRLVDGCRGIIGDRDLKAGRGRVAVAVRHCQRKAQIKRGQRCGCIPVVDHAGLRIGIAGLIAVARRGLGQRHGEHFDTARTGRDQPVGDRIGQRHAITAQPQRVQRGLGGVKAHTHHAARTVRPNHNIQVARRNQRRTRHPQTVLGQRRTSRRSNNRTVIGDCDVECCVCGVAVPIDEGEGDVFGDGAACVVCVCVQRVRIAYNTGGRIKACDRDRAQRCRHRGGGAWCGCQQLGQGKHRASHLKRGHAIGDRHGKLARDGLAHAGGGGAIGQIAFQYSPVGACNRSVIQTAKGARIIHRRNRAKGDLRGAPVYRAVIGRIGQRRHRTCIVGRRGKGHHAVRINRQRPDRRAITANQRRRLTQNQRIIHPVPARINQRRSNAQRVAVHIRIIAQNVLRHWRVFRNSDALRHANWRVVHGR